MRSMLVALAITGTLGLASPQAFAADAVTEYEPAPIAPAAAYSWTGVYIGAHAGYGFGDYRQFSASGLGVGVDVDGFVGGATLGYNWQWDSFVIGLEADISNGPRGRTPVGTAGPFWSCNTGACNVDIEWFGTVRARAGFAADRFLIYATGGFAYGDVRGGIANSAQQGGGTATGWTAGGGVEYAWTQNWTTKVEYLHVDLGDIPFGTGIGTERFKGDGAFNVVRFGLNYKF